MRKTILAVLVICGGLVFGRERTKVAVMDLKAKTGMDEMTASMLTDVLCTEIKELGEYKVISREDIKAMLSHVQDQQLLGCDDTRCLAKIGGALGVPLLIYGNIGKLGSIYLVNLKLIDIDNVDVVNRITEEFSGDEGGLINLIRNSVMVLFGKPGRVKQRVGVAAEPGPGSAAATGTHAGFLDLGVGYVAGTDESGPELEGSYRHLFGGTMGFSGGLLLGLGNGPRFGVRASLHFQLNESFGVGLGFRGLPIYIDGFGGPALGVYISSFYARGGYDILGSAVFSVDAGYSLSL